MSFKNFYIIISVAIIISVSACKTVKPYKPMEQYEDLKEEFKLSEINLPMSIDFAAMQSEINAELGGIIYEETTDDYSVRAEKTADVQLTLNDQELSYYVPLKLWVKKACIAVHPAMVRPQRFATT